MTLIPFNKPAKTYQEQLSLLKSRGMKVNSDTKAIYLLEKLSYYRLSGYWYPLLEDPKDDHIFKSNATFETAFQIYKFDRDFRIIILKELEKIEIAIRSHMVYELSHTKAPFWLSESSNFSNPTKHAKSISTLTNDYTKSDEEFIRAYRSKYSESLPPSWILFEISSFGCVSKIYDNLRPDRSKRNIANQLGLDENTFSSWLHSFTYLRNVCAHHSRLWNRAMSIRPRRLISPSKIWLNDDTVSNSKTYYILCMMLYLLQSVDKKHQFIFRIKMLLKKYKNIDVKAMGFPEKWEKEPLWHFKPTLKQWLRLNLMFALR